MVNKLAVLLWKHFIVRRRRFIHTPIEWLSPVIFFVLLFVFRHELNPIPKHSSAEYGVHETESLRMDEIKAPHTVLFTPSTDVTLKLMAEVGMKLNLPKRSGQPTTQQKGYYPVSSDPLVIKETIHKLEGTNYGVIIFENIDVHDTVLPTKLNYTIRMPLPYDVFDSDATTMDYHTDFGTQYEPFMRLQWAVDSSFLEMKTNKTITQRVSLQEFPYATSARYPMINGLQLLLTYFSWASLLLPFVFLSSRLLGERVSGIREMIHMVGVPSGLLHLSHFINASPGGLVYSVAGAALLTVGYNPLLRFTNPVLVWLMLALYFVQVIAIAYTTSSILKKEQYGVTFACLMYTVTLIAGQLVVSYPGPRWAQPLAGLVPHAPMMWFWKNVGALEKFGQGLSFSNMARTHTPDAASALACYLMLALQTLLLGLLAWYLDRVSPGPYGQAQPWNFCFQREFWGKKVVPEDSLEESQPVDAQDPQYFEPARGRDGAGIRIVNVTKVYPKHKALSNVSLDIASGEITVLLGHNGAGKTTLMSIITGMLSPTEGSVFVGGLDAQHDRDAVRAQLGLCPQHNLFFPDLTVLDHVMFYTLLKGRAYGSARKSCMSLLEQLGLADKAHGSSGALSGGMRRRLQLACALAGDARVLVLDEPTSGLDVETRRGLWDLLLSLRGDRVVLISTHFMEEADALGDRVAALQAGRLRCFASPMHLKRALGTGYRLTCQTLGAPHEPAITSLVTSRVAGAALRESTLNSVSYSLPAEQTGAFPSLFQELETRRSELQVDTIGVGASTLEEVFLKLCSDTADVSSLDEVDADAGSSVSPEYTGARLLARQFCVLFARHFHYLAAHKMSFIFLQVLIPVALFVAVTFASNNYTESAGAYKRPVTLDQFSHVDRKVLVNLHGELAPETVEGWYPGVTVTPSRNITEDIIRIGKRDITEYNKYLVGVEINNTDAKFYYTTVRHHAAPAAANTLANTLGAALGAGARAIATYSDPVRKYVTVNITFRSKALDSLFLWASMIVFVVMSTLINAVTLPCKERLSGARHMQVLAGARAPLPWLAALAAHALTYACVLVLPVIVAAAAIDTDHTIDQPDFLGVLFLTLMTGILAFLALSYLVSFWFGERGAGGVLIAAVIVFGFVTPTAYTVMDLVESFSSRKSPGWGYYLVMTLGYVMPPHQFTTAVMRATYVASNNAEVNLRPNGGGKTKCYLCFDEYAPGETILVLLAHLLVYMTLVILTEYGVFGAALERVAGALYSEPGARDADDVVRAETEYVRKAIDLPKDKISDALLAYNLHKKYTKILGKSCNAVKGVSFSVKKGEIFGLLGVNGAGKTSVFKMLTGLERPTRGRVFAAGRHLDRARHRYLRALGYCPQFGGLDDFLTCEGNLRLLLALRGLAAGGRGAGAPGAAARGGAVGRLRAAAGGGGGAVRRRRAAAGRAQRRRGRVGAPPAVGRAAAGGRARRRRRVLAQHGRDGGAVRAHRHHGGRPRARARQRRGPARAARRRVRARAARHAAERYRRDGQRWRRGVGDVTEERAAPDLQLYAQGRAQDDAALPHRRRATVQRAVLAAGARARGVPAAAGLRRHRDHARGGVPELRARARRRGGGGRARAAHAGVDAAVNHSNAQHQRVYTHPVERVKPSHPSGVARKQPRPSDVTRNVTTPFRFNALRHDGHHPVRRELRLAGVLNRLSKYLISFN